MKRFNLIIVAAVLAFYSFTSLALNKVYVKSKINQINTAIKTKKNSYDEARAKYLHLSKQLKQINSKITILKQNIDKNQKDLKVVMHHIHNLEAHIKDLSRQLSVKKKKLSMELKNYYYYSRFSQYYTNGVWYEYMNGFVSRYMQDEIHTYINKKQSLKNSLMKLKKYKKRKDIIVSSIEKQSRELQGKKLKLAALVKRVKSEKENYLVQIRQLNKKRVMLERLLDKIIKAEEKRKRLLAEKARRKMHKKEKAVKPTKIGLKLIKREFPILKRKIMPPIRGKIIGTFGKKYDTIAKVYTRNDGIDIKSKKGTCVRVIYKGKIDFSGELPGFGMVVIVNHHNNYYTVYSGLSTHLKVGEAVKTRQCIGKLAGSVLHFEIRRHYTALDPLNFLNRRYLR